MSKIICGVFFAVAFIYALYLVFTRRNLKRVKDTLKYKSAFNSAVFICCAAIISSVSCQPEITCYDPAPAKSEERTAELLKSAWLALDFRRDAEFQKIVDDFIRRGLIENNTAIGLAYQELSNYIAFKNMLVLCYFAGGNNMRGHSNDAILKQLELLNKIKNEGKLNEETVEKIRQSIAYQLEGLVEMSDKAKYEDNKEYFSELENKYKNNELLPSEEVKKTAGIIVEMEKSREKWDLINDEKNMKRR